MADINLTNKQVGEVLEASDFNDLTSAVQGLSVDSDNIALGSVTRNHQVQNEKNIFVGTTNTLVTSTINPSAAATPWSTIAQISVSQVLDPGSVLRTHFNPLMGDVTEAVGTTDLQQEVMECLFYQKIQIAYNTGGVTQYADITPVYGYHLLANGGTYYSNFPYITLHWERLPINSVYFVRDSNFVLEEVNLLAKWQNSDAVGNTAEYWSCLGWATATQF